MKKDMGMINYIGFGLISAVVIFDIITVIFNPSIFSNSFVPLLLTALLVLGIALLGE